MDSLLVWTLVLLIICIFAFSLWFVIWRMRYRWRLWVRILVAFGTSALLLSAVLLVTTLQFQKRVGSARMPSKVPDRSLPKAKPSPPPPASSQGPDSAAPQGTKKRKAHKKAASAAASPSADELWQKAVDSLPTGKMLVSHPPTMRLRKTSPVVVRISAVPLPTLSTGLDAGNVNNIEDVRISDYTMKVRLGGAPNFDITQLDSEEQALGQKDFAQWRFDVTPLKAGKHIPLHLTVVAVLRTPWGVEKTRDIPVKDEYVDVQVTAIERVRDFLGPKWQWIAGSLVIPLVGWLWKRYLDRKNETGERKPKKIKKAKTGK